VQWSLFRFCQLENEEMEELCKTIAQFTNAWSIHRGFFQVKTMDDDKKSLFRNWQLEFFHCAFANPCML
jgi:hypothetical protein